MEYKVKKKEYKGNVRWCVYTRTFSDKDMFTSYSESIFGKYAKAMAEATAKTGIKYKNYYEIEMGLVKMIIYSKKMDMYHNVLFDIEFLPLVMEKRWSVILKNKNSTPYCQHCWNGEDGKVKHLMLHHLIMGKHDGKLIDHINGNGLDNRKQNLRIVDHSTNNKNRRYDYKIISENIIYNKRLETIIVKYKNKKLAFSYKYFNLCDYENFDIALEKAQNFLDKKKKKSKKDKERTILHLRKKK